MRKSGKLCVKIEGWKHSVKILMRNEIRKKANVFFGVAKHQVLHLRKKLFE